MPDPDADARVLPEVDVSVIICVRNGEATLARQLDALAAQVDAPPFEVIIVDNGSTDGTLSVATGWRDSRPEAVSAVRILDASQRAGIPFARNQGAKAASGRLLGYCDADDAVGPGWVAAMSRSVSSGLGGGRIRAFRINGTAEPGAFPDGLLETVYLPQVSGCNFAVTRETFWDVGGFDESLPPYGCDDLEFSWRIQEAGHPIQFIPEAVVDFTITPRNKVVRKEFRMAKARMAVTARHPASGPAPTLLGVVFDPARQTLLIGWRMLRPGTVPRSRWIRWWVDSYGRLAGYWTYYVRRRPAQTLNNR